MSDPTTTTNQYDAARTREALELEYRTAYRATRVGNAAKDRDRLTAAAIAVFAAADAFDGPDTPETFIFGIERDVDYELNLDVGRTEIEASLKGVDEALAKVRKAMKTAEKFGDIEAEMTPEMEAAFAHIGVGLAALKHHLRYAIPDGHQ